MELYSHTNVTFCDILPLKTALSIYFNLILPGQKCREKAADANTFQLPHGVNCRRQNSREATGPGSYTLSLFVGQHSLCPLHVSLQQLSASDLTGLLGRGHCGHLGLGTGGGAAGHTGEILSRLRRTMSKPMSSRLTVNRQVPLEFPGQEFPS